MLVKSLQPQAPSGATLGANTFSGDQTFDGHELIHPKMRLESSARAPAAITSGVLNLDFAYGFIDVSLNANVNAITTSNVLASASVGQTIIVSFKANGTARSVIWPHGDGVNTDLFVWDGGNLSGSGYPAAVPSSSTNGRVMEISITPVSAHLFRCAVIAANFPA